MTSLARHTRTPDPEAHAGLAFRADCPACRSLRLAGPLPAPEVVPRRAKAAVVAGLVAASGLTPVGLGSAQATPPDDGNGEERVLPPGGVAEGDDGAEPPLPSLEEDEDEEAPAQGVPPVSGPQPEPRPPASPSGDGDGGEPEPRQEETRSDESPRPNGDEPQSGARGNPQEADEGGSSTPAEPAEGVRRAPRQEAGSDAAGRQATGDAGERRRTSEPSTRQRSNGVRGERAPSEPQRQTRRDSEDRAPDERTHVVRAGECLWRIAERRLDDDATDAEIAREVNRLWELNDRESIRTGDRDLILPGQVLRL